MFIGFDDFFHVFVADGALVGGILAAEALAEDIDRSLEIDDEVGSGEFGAEELVVAIVNGELFVAEIEVGEKFILFEDVVGDHYFLRLLRSGERAKLLEAADEEGKLGLESRSGIAIIKSREEGILLWLLHQLAVHLLGEEVGKSALADANRTFYGDVSGWFEEISHCEVSDSYVLSSGEAYRGACGGSNRVEGRSEKRRFPKPFCSANRIIWYRTRG